MLTVRPDNTDFFLSDLGAIVAHRHLVFKIFLCYQPSWHFAALNFIPQFLRHLHQVCRRGFLVGNLKSDFFFLHHFLKLLLAELILILTQL